MDDSFEVRLFGPDLPATGEDARLILSPTQVEVRAARGSRRVPLSQLRLREVVSAHAGLELSWDARGGVHAVQLFDPESLRRLRSDPVMRHLPQMADIRRGERRGRALRTLAWSLLAVVVVLPLLLLGLFLWQADRIAGALAARIPVAQEQQLGRQVFARMRGGLKLLEDGTELDAVRNLGARLTQGSRFNYEFHVARDASINAFALPGGIIIVHTGLIDRVRRPEELAGVLAHEVQHVEQRHSLEAIVKELGLRGVWAAATGDVGGSLAGNAALKLASLRFSRGAEHEADALGFDALVEQGMDPRGMVDFFGTLQQAAGASPPAWLSTHPPSEARRKALAEKLDALGARAFAPLPEVEPAAP